MLSGAGDVLQATPLIKEIRKKHPKAEVDALVMQNILTKEILLHNPDLDNVTYFNFPKEGYLKSLKFCLSLWKKYDLSITTYPQARFEYSLVTSFINAKKKIGFSYDSEKLGLSKLLYDPVQKENFEKHVVQNNLDILPIFGVDQSKLKPELILKVDKSSKDFAKDFFKKNKLKKTVVLHAGSGLTKNFILKRWPIENFAELSKQLAKLGYKVLIIQGPEEKDINSEIISLSGLKKNKDIFIVEEDILKAAAIMEKSNLIISNDTVIGHMAAALKTKVISLFGPTSPENAAPFTQNKIVICKRPTHIKPYKHGLKGITSKQARYMNEITVEEVLKHVN
jgi:ADP-heptose:LPS heptosyltransferase